LQHLVTFFLQLVVPYLFAHHNIFPIRLIVAHNFLFFFLLRFLLLLSVFLVLLVFGFFVFLICFFYFLVHVFLMFFFIVLFLFYLVMHVLLMFFDNLQPVRLTVFDNLLCLLHHAQKQLILLIFFFFVHILNLPHLLIFALLLYLMPLIPYLLLQF